jgi:hypothetical protein
MKIRYKIPGSNPDLEMAEEGSDRAEALALSSPFIIVL